MTPRLEIGANWRSKRQATIRCCLIAAACLFLLPSTETHAADRVYWGSYGGSPETIAFANLDGSAGSDLNTTGATLNEPLGLAIDVVAGKVYWANDAAPKISFANLDGSGGGDLNTAGATTNPLAGIAVHPAAGKIYWANYSPDSISYASLDGSGGGDLNTAGATVQSPVGVAIDAAGGKIYWANREADTISYANLDGSGGGDLNITGATLSQPSGLAIDEAAGKVYWANNSPANTISFANLNGSGAGDLTTTGATVQSPQGVAIDPGAGRVYWANFGPTDSISYANLDGSGGGDLTITGVTVDNPAFPVLLRAPDGIGAPQITGRSAPGSPLSCSEGSWAPDLLGSFLYRVPQSVAYEWIADGAGIAAAPSPSIAATLVGNYQCRVTAQNQAGVASQTSALHAIFKIGKARLNKRRGTARLPVTIPGSGVLKLTGKGVVARRIPRPSKASDAVAPAAASKRTVRLLVKLKAKRRKKLNRTGKAKVKLAVTFTPSGGAPGTQTRRVKLRKAVRR